MDQESITNSSFDSPRSSIEMKVSNCPPPLGYSLRDRKVAITICWTLVLIDSCLLAVGLFYPLWYATSMSKTNVMTIVSCLAGMFSLFQFFWRTWILFRRESARPIDGSKWGFDMFQWIYVVAVVFVSLELVFGTIPDMPNIALCSMPVPTVFFLAACAELLATIGYLMNIRVPITISSVKRGDICRPGVYTIIEDIIAVDGHGCLEFRHALDKRYRASPEFRKMLATLSLFWSIPALLVAAGCTATIWTTDVGVAFGVGWAAPFVWAAVWAVITVLWVPRMLRKERMAWEKANTGV